MALRKTSLSLSSLCTPHLPTDIKAADTVVSRYKAVGTLFVFATPPLAEAALALLPPVVVITAW